MRFFFSLLISLALLALNSCKTESTENRRPKITCTTNILGDLVQELTQDFAEVQSLMGAGVDPHLYRATQGDLARLSEADLIVFHGLHLEGKMTDVLEKLQKQEKAFAATESLTESALLKSEEGIPDPHVWFEVALWQEIVAHTAKKIQAKFPEHTEEVQMRSQKYLEKLKTLDQEVRRHLSEIPEEKRRLVTSHDAFRYFGRAYGVEVRALQGISTAEELSLKQRQNIVNYVKENNIRAVFVETSVSRKSLEAVVEDCTAEGYEVRIGGKLYTDALGAANSPAGNYLGMWQENLHTIVEALR